MWIKKALARAFVVAGLWGAAAPEMAQADPAPVPPEITGDILRGNFQTLHDYLNGSEIPPPTLDSVTIIMSDVQQSEINLGNARIESLFISGNIEDNDQDFSHISIQGGHIKEIIVNSGSVQFQNLEADSVIIASGNNNITFDSTRLGELRARNMGDMTIENSYISRLAFTLGEMHNLSISNTVITNADFGSNTFENTGFDNVTIERTLWMYEARLNNSDLGGLSYNSLRAIFLDAGIDEATAITNPALAQNIEIANSPAPTNETLVDIHDPSKPIELMTTLLARNDGLFLGDHHSIFEIRQYIAENMAALANSGVETLYIEFVESHKNQMIQDYYNDVPGAREVLQEHFTKSWYGPRNGGEGIMMVLDAARQNGIRVVGIDNNSLDQDDREFFGKVMFPTERNQAWVDAILADREQTQGKYIVWGGATHGDSRAQMQGIDLALEIPEIHFDLSDDTTTQVSREVNYRGADYLARLAPAAN